MTRVLVITGFLFFPLSYAHAYFDPGTGSAIIQGVIAALMGGAFFIKLYWGKIISLFQKNSDKKNNN